MDQEEIEAMKKWIDARKSRLGHAAAYARRTPLEGQIVEMEVAREFAAAAKELFGLVIEGIRPNPKPNKAPDVFAEMAGREISIELTEMVNSDHLEKIQREIRTGGNPSQYNSFGAGFDASQIDEPMFGRLLCNTVERKAKKYENANRCIDILVVHTDEPWLTHHDAARWLANVKVRRSPSISNCFLLFSIPPLAEHCPVFHLFGDMV